MKNSANPSLDELGLSVLRSACNSEAKDLAVEWAEVGLDSHLAESTLKDAPMFGTVLKLCAISKTVRDLLFVKKVWGFLRASPKFNDLEKLGFVREHLDEPQKARRLSGAIVLILDRLDDIEKAPLLAKCFAALVRKHIDYADFRRLSAGLERAFIDDLKILTANPRNPQLKQERFLRVLEPAGFVSTVGAGLPSAIPGVSTEVNALGRLFQKCVLEE